MWSIEGSYVGVASSTSLMWSDDRILLFGSVLLIVFATVDFPEPDIPTMIMQAS